MSIKKNYIYNLLYQIMIMFLPLITIPYISRVLGPDGVGIFAYTSSIVQYFAFIGMLGIGTYGNRLIAMTRDNKKLMSENFFNVYVLQVVMSLTSVISYIILIVFFFQEHKYIALIQVITLLATVIDCTWFFNRLEYLKKLLSELHFSEVNCFSGCTFIFVKSPNDLDMLLLYYGNIYIYWSTCYVVLYKRVYIFY